MPDLTRFHAAQADVIDTALAELRAGRKRTHWMWFVFPQVSGLGTSTMAQRYAITDLAEARAYLADPVLRERLSACITALLTHRDRDPVEILGPVDALKLRSSLTLFEAAAPGETEFSEALDAFFGGKRDQATLDRLASH